VAEAKAIGNHIMDAEVVAYLKYKTDRIALELQGLSPQEIDRILAPPPARRGMPTTGTVKVLAILIAFSDYAPLTSAQTVASRLFGPEDATDPTYPYETLRAYYQRSSYSQLDIQGNVLGWYTTSYPRSSVNDKADSSRENLIKEVLNYYDQQGHDFSQYDNNNDGIIDYFLVFWTGPHGEWATFWWGYQTSFSDSSYLLDGKRLRKYSWQWELYSYPSGEFSPKTPIHETGHALGLPDYYDYDDSLGPMGGVGGFDMMDSSNYDHNCFSKFVLDWLTPEVFNSGIRAYTLRASGAYTEALLFFPGAQQGVIFDEYFMVQNRYAAKNDSRLTSINSGNVGLAVWHVDARLNGSGTNFLYDNSYTDHKLLMLLQADGLDEIENGIRGFNSADFYRPGNELGPSTHPDTSRYDGMPTGMGITDIQGTGPSITFQAYANANPRLRLSVSPLNFGNVNVCTLSDQIVTIYNDGQGPLIVGNITKSSGAADFSYMAPSLPFSVAAGSSKDITFRFNVYNTGSLTASFSIASNDPDHPQTILNVNGFGFIPEITLNLQVERKVERAWIIRRGFAAVTIQVSKSAPFVVETYQLSRTEAGSTGDPLIIKDFQESDFEGGRLVYFDKYLEFNKSYVYTIEAIDCYGRVITYSSQQRQSTDLKNKIMKPIMRIK
jgi:M6 family metalloprotease-like protein